VGWDNSQVYPVIESVSQHAGSMAGGLLLTLTGKAFSATAERNAVDIDGVPCTVVRATNTELVCRTGQSEHVPTLCSSAADCEAAVGAGSLCMDALCTAAAAIGNVTNETATNETVIDDTAAAAAEPRLYVGGRGVRQTMWRNGEVLVSGEVRDWLMTPQYYMTALGGGKIEWSEHSYTGQILDNYRQYFSGFLMPHASGAYSLTARALPSLWGTRSSQQGTPYARNGVRPSLCLRDGGWPLCAGWATHPAVALSNSCLCVVLSYIRNPLLCLLTLALLDCPLSQGPFC
jgi:hypothetical protein